MKYFGRAAAAVAVAAIMAAPPTWAADRLAPQASSAQGHRSPSLQRQHAISTREPEQQEAGGARSQVHPRFGEPRLDQRPDPNYQNPYRPMFSPNAVNPGEQHPYFRTPQAGFGYPTGNSGIYQGNGVYIIPR